MDDDKKEKIIIQISLWLYIFGVSLVLFCGFVGINLAIVIGSIIIILGNVILLFAKRNTVIKFSMILMTVIVLIIGGNKYLENREKELDHTPVQSTLQSEYNAEFVTYDGQINVKGANIKKLIEDVIKHNTNNEYNSAKWINVIVDDEGIDSNKIFLEKTAINNNGVSDTPIIVSEYNERIGEELSKIKNSEVYSVLCGYDPVTGYVVNIQIYKVNK